MSNYPVEYKNRYDSNQFISLYELAIYLGNLMSAMNEFIVLFMSKSHQGVYEEEKFMKLKAN